MKKAILLSLLAVALLLAAAGIRHEVKWYRASSPNTIVRETCLFMIAIYLIGAAIDGLLIWRYLWE